MIHEDESLQKLLHKWKKLEKKKVSNQCKYIYEKDEDDYFN